MRVPSNVSKNVLQQFRVRLLTSVQRVGARSAAAHDAMHAPWATLQPAIVAGTAAPAVTTPAVPPGKTISKWNKRLIGCASGN